MRKAVVTGFLFLAMARVAMAQSGVSYHQLTLLEQEILWLQTGNAAGVELPDSFSLSNLQASYLQQQGAFKLSHEGSRMERFSFQSEGYKKLGKTSIYGKMEYLNGTDVNACFSNVNQPGQVYPYLFRDSVGNDTYKREFFSFQSGLSVHKNERFNWGISCRYRTGVASQNRDPRPKNTVVDLAVNPGIALKIRKHTLGVNADYNYYNEDIDVAVIQEHTDHTLFMLHGPAVYTTHSSSSFNRLYQQHGAGGGTQYHIKGQRLESLTGLKFLYRNQMVYDGRKLSGGSWSAIKTDGQVQNNFFDFQQQFRLKKDRITHALNAACQLQEKRGTEYLQKLEQQGDTDLEHWVTYARLQKYNAKRLALNLHYNRLKTDEFLRLKNHFKLEGLFGSHSEVYLNHFDGEEYMNPELSRQFVQGTASYTFIMYPKKQSLACTAEAGYHHNLNQTMVLPENWMTDNVYKPDFNVLTANVYGGGLSLLYEYLPKKSAVSWFVSGVYRIMSDIDRNNKRHTIQLKTGMNF